jgi:hypothetical protein
VAVRSLVIAAVTISCALATAGCGSSNRPGSGTGPQDNPQSPAFKSASTTCDKLLPGGYTPPPKPSESRRLAMLRFAQCMRKHGVSNFPDPTLSLPPANVPVIAVAGIYFALPPGLDFQSPAVKQARTACKTGRGPL